MKDSKEITTTTRMTESFYEEIKAISNECSNSVNGTMNMLIRLGINVYKAQINYLLQQK